MAISIGIATIDDFEAVNEIVKEGHEEHVEALPNVFKSVAQVMPTSYYQELLEDNCSEILVAKEGLIIVGFAVMSMEKSPSFDSLVEREYAYINDFGIKSGEQRKGIGKILFEACVSWAKAREASSLELNVWEFNEKAMLFYDSFGMETISRKMQIKF
ncbi:GNAT family N-acetyltransferase [Solibacillus sp. FSL H8-0538]|uniref:GNAT family N-acetyltransferase n=1 Tax=Solibacillus sp. FSL H8-0538 TaxID=2921400 RepID=UPI0030F624C0